MPRCKVMGCTNQSGKIKKNFKYVEHSKNSKNVTFHKYFTKKEANESISYNSKRLYCERRGTTWYPNNKRPGKIKDKLRELEDYLFQEKIVCCTWENNEFRILLSNGLLIDITISPYTNDIVNISINKSLTAKIGTELICDGSFSSERVACICTDGRVLCFGGIWKDGWTITECHGKKSIALHDQLLCIWGCKGVDHPQPWSPLTKDHHRANLLLYNIGLGGPELIAYKKTEAEPIQVIISKIRNRNLIVVEQKVSSRGVVSVEVNTLEASSNVLKRLSLTSVPLQTQISCCTLSDSERQLVLGCIDGSVAVLDRNSGLTRIIKTSIIPSFAVWHRAGAIVAITNEKGQLQYFDVALNRINIQLSGEESTPVGLLDLSAYFGFQQNVSHVYWGFEHLLVAFEHGPLALITHPRGSLTFISLIRRYLKIGKIDKSISLLLNWEWNDRCFFALQHIVSNLLKLPLTNETARHLQDTLSSFHNPSVPLSASVQHKYGSQVRALTRRFFHQLVRYRMFETAFLLAVDIGHHDLFMDLYHCATEMGEKEMAAAARAQASALLSRCSSEASCCSRSSCSQCSGSCSDDTDSVSSQDNNKEEHSLHFPPLEYRSGFNDGCLSTNFNNVNPKTYNPTENSVLSGIDLPKVTMLPKPLFNNKAPSFPPVPPLPVTFNTRNFPLPENDYGGNCCIKTNTLPPPPMPKFPKNSFSRMNDASLTLITPTLPQTVPSFSLATVSCPSPPPPPLPLSQIINQPSTGNNTSGGKKQQAKVKFSDTVTAFIVPEIKRPVRPPPPPHITDPQKELADSLPLCHPNEDYLKDFTPVRRNESDDSPPPTQAKIKVVHFGVV